MADLSDDEFNQILSQDQGNSIFADYGEVLRRRGKLLEGINVCINGLTVNPSAHRGRLILARIFYDMGCIPFALRELEFICAALPESKSLRKLTDKLLFMQGHTGLSMSKADAQSSTEETTVAETEFGFDELELIGEEEKSE